MNTQDVFQDKAEKYHRYRWDYAPQAIQTIFNVTGLGAHSVMADVGAGTGIFSRHFAGKVGQLYAIEPNPAMRHFAQETLRDCASCQVMDASAEAIPLSDHSVDLISAAQAIHWFSPEPTRAEFRPTMTNYDNLSLP